MKAKRPLKNYINKASHMAHEAFADLKKALEDALAFERGQLRELNVTRIQAPHTSKAT